VRDGLRNEEASSFTEGLLSDTEPIFDRTPEVGLPPSSGSEDDEEDNTPLRWALQRRMVHITKMGKEEVVEETPTRKPSTMGAIQKLMSDVMKARKTSTTEIRRRRESGVEELVIPDEGVVNISNEHSESDTVSEDVTMEIELRRKRNWERRRENQSLRIHLLKRMTLYQKENLKKPPRKKGKER